MGIKKNIQRIIFICFWVLAGTGIVALLIAGVNARSHQVCKGYEINIHGSDKGNWYLKSKDILKMITGNEAVALKNKPVKSFDLNGIEIKLQKHAWVKDAELFFDNKGILKVKITEREPVARVFSAGGESFYIDSTGQKLPLADKMPGKLPVFTGFPYSRKKPVEGAERKLLKQIKELSVYLLDNPFWMAQIAQIDITPVKEFEMVPTIGNHLIEFGDARNKEDKFQRLFVFYRQVLAKTGMEKYERIKVQYDRQVIGVKKINNN